MKLYNKTRNEVFQPEVLLNKLNASGKLCRKFFTRYFFLAVIRGIVPDYPE